MASSGGGTIGWADILFMAALLFDIWPTNNPINSSHSIELIAYLGIATVGPGTFSLQNWMVKKFPLMSWAK